MAPASSRFDSAIPNRAIEFEHTRFASVPACEARWRPEETTPFACRSVARVA